MKNKITIIISILSLTVITSAQSNAKLFETIEKTIFVPNVLQINNCAKWYVDFNTLKKTVIYSDKIISMGLYGGFVCLDYNSFAFDESYSNKLNSDFFTNLACYDDTLFAEKFDEIFFLSKNDTTWCKYNRILPVKFFSIIYQDPDYIFYPLDYGEMGGVLFIYDKAQNVTKGLYTDHCANAIIKTNNKFLISNHTRHMTGFSDLFSLQNIDSMPVLFDHSNKLSVFSPERHWKGETLLSIICPEKYPNENIKIDESNKAVYYKQEKSSLIGTIISSTFLFQNSIYHFIEVGPEIRNGKIKHSKIEDGVILSGNEHGKLIYLDSIKSFRIEFTNSFNEDYIFNAAASAYGYMILQKNRLIRIKFEPQTSYKIEEKFVEISGDFEKISKITLNDKIINKDSITEENVIQDNSNRRSRNINYQINKHDIIYSEYSRCYENCECYEHNNYNRIFINYHGKEKRLKFDNSNTIIQYAFKDSGSDFLYLYCLGENDKYGLIEIIDLEKFVNYYGEKSNSHNRILDRLGNLSHQLINRFRTGRFKRPK